jgi:hypothetical protein
MFCLPDGWQDSKTPKRQTQNPAADEGGHDRARQGSAADKTKGVKMKTVWEVELETDPLLFLDYHVARHGFAPFAFTLSEAASGNREVTGVFRRRLTEREAVPQPVPIPPCPTH